MKLDFVKTYDNSKRNITKTSLARSLKVSRQQIHNYYTGANKMGKNEAKLIEIFANNGDTIYEL